VAEEDASVGQRGAAGCVGSYRAKRLERLAGATDQEEGTHASLGCDGASGQNAQAGSGSQGGDRDQADVRRARGQAVGALCGAHAVDLVAKGERGVEGRMFKVPHQRRGIEKANGGDSQTGWGQGSHAFLEYFP